MEEMLVKSKIKNFKVNFTDNFDFISELLTIRYYVVITGLNVYRFYKEKIFDKFPNERVIVLDLREEKKTIDTAIKIYKRLLRLPAKKNLVLIAFGGGVNQDISGFVASTLYRGIDWIYIPTTLLSMADSAVGLKTSLNIGSYKNLIGTFYPPSQIYIDLDFLNTLKKEDYYSGAGEIIKLFLMQENTENNLDDIIDRMRTLLLRKERKEIINCIQQAIEIKLSYMQGDEQDLGKRNLLNYGHEIGHSLESSSNFAIPHGVAVMVGIIFSNYISVSRGWLTFKTFNYINSNVLLPAIYQSSVKLNKEYFDKRKILDSLKHDKKRIGNGLVLILPQRNFSLIKIQDLKETELEDGLVQVNKICKEFRT